MRSIKQILVAVPMILLLSGCSFLEGTAIEGSGKSKSEERNVGAFDRVAVSGSFQVDIRSGKARKVRIEADDNLLPLIESKVVNGGLEIGFKGRVSTHSAIKVWIENPHLKGFALNGSGQVTIQGVKEPSFETSISGSGSIAAKGTTDSLTASIAGSGSIDLQNLSALDGKLSISGSGEIFSNVSRSLQASIAGSGEITYSGNPKVETSIAGSGKVHRASE